MVKLIDTSKIKIIHLANSETLVSYDKLKFVNGTRLGIIMYGFTNDKSLELKSTFGLYSKVAQIKNIKKGECVGYDSTYIASEDEKIAIVQIGYADGIIRKNTGRYVYINNKKYIIIGNICMDMLMIKIDSNVKLYDEVVILKDNEHINYVAKHTNTIPYEIICNITKRVDRVYEGESLINAIENDTETEVNANDGLQPVLIGLAAKKSVQEGRPVTIKEIADEYNL